MARSDQKLGSKPFPGDSHASGPVLQGPLSSMPSFTLYFVFLLVWELPGHAEILVGQSVTHAQGKMDHLLAYCTGPQPLEGEVLHQEANNFQAVPG